MMTRRSFAKVTAMLAGGAALGLAGCMNGDPNKGNGGNGNSGNGGSGNNSGGNNGNNGNTPAPDPEPAKPKLPELTAFNNVFFTQDGTCYVGMPSTFPFYEVEAVEPASYGWLDIPDTTPVKFADYFAVYDGKLYFTEFFHPSDAAARKTPLYMANPDGSNIRVVLDDVACECRPWIVNGVLYYESFDYDEGERIYTHEGTNGGTIQSADAMNCTTVLRSYNMTTGATASVDITRTMAGSFIGATAQRVYTLISAWDDNSTCMSYALDFSDPQPFSTTGYPLGMDAKGHIITRGWSGTTSIWRVCDSDGTVLETFSVTDYGSAFSANRYLIFEDKSKATVVYDTVEMKQIKRVTRLDDWSSTRTYYYYNPYTDTVYYIGKHGTVPGIETAVDINLYLP